MTLDLEPGELARRLQQISDAFAQRDYEQERQFVEGLDTLRRLGGKPSLAAEAARFSQSVAKTLECAGATVVAEIPRSGGVDGQPDIVVEAGESRFVVNAKGPVLLSGASILENAERLDELRKTLHAEHAFLVVRYRAIPLLDWDRVSVVTLPQLLERIRQSSNRNEVNVA
jgi:hypothetical protein